MQTNNKRDLYVDKVAAQIIEAIEAGTAPWMKEWTGAAALGFAPHNPTTGKPYNGINAINLMMQGYSDPRWMTYKQANEMGAQVKGGESGTLIQYWKFKEKREVIDENGNKVLDEKGKPIKKEFALKNPRVFYAIVFNAEQIEGLEPFVQKEIGFNSNDLAEEILKNSGAKIDHVAGDKAFYRPGSDEIVLPLKEQFKSQAGYYATALHELGHWTGHESRLNRDLSGGFGSESYAKEELRAEIASFMLSTRIGVDFNPIYPNNHFAYINSWVKAIEDKPTEIFKAASDAEKITTFIEGLSMQKEQHKMYDSDGSLAFKEAIKRIDISKGDASFGLPVPLNDGTVIMEHLTGGTVDTVRSEGLYLFAGEPGKMKPLKSLSLDEAKALIQDTYSIEQNKTAKPKLEKKAGAFLDSSYYYDEIRNEINSYLKDMKLTLNQELIKEYEAAVVGMIESDGGYTIAEAVKEVYYDVIPSLDKQTYLYVPTEQKEAAKSVGCRWDAENKAWYAQKGTLVPHISEWMLDNQQTKNGIMGYISSESDPMISFRDELLKRGWDLRGEPIADGRIHAVHIQGHSSGTRNGRYAIHQDGVQTLWLKDWKTGDEATIVHKDSKFNSSIDEKTIETQKEINRIKNVQSTYDKNRMHYAVAKRLENEITNLSPAPADNFYLVKKGLSPTEGIKVDEYGNLIIPFQDKDGKIKTVQKIMKQEDGRYLKLFEKGGEKSGNYHLINGYKDATTVVICEGYATGATINQATGFYTIVAGDSGNIIPVLDKLIDKKNFSKIDEMKIIIAADNDVLVTKPVNNPGLTKAKEAAAYIAEKYPDLKDKIVVAAPSFTSEEIKSKATDFNDLAQNRGNDVVKKQIDLALMKLDKNQENQKENVALKQQTKDTQSIGFERSQKR